MKQRILTAIVIIAVILPPVLLGGTLLKLLGVFIIGAGCYEVTRALPHFKQWGILVTPLMAAWVLLMYFVPQSLMLPWWIGGCVLFWSLPIFIASFTENEALTVLAWMMIFGLCWISMQMLIPQHKYLWTLCLATYGSDTGAYFFGRAFGAHKMIERVSPKKTWEGFFGGLLVGFLLSFVVSMLYWKDLNFVMNLMICILAPAFAELGDLCFSSFKREYHLKDFSNLLPGHGGVMDRVDSLMMNFLLFGVLASLF